MTSTNLIFNINLVREHKKDFLLTLLMQSKCGWNVDWDSSMYYCGEKPRMKPKDLAAAIGLSVNRTRDHMKNFEDNYSFQGSFAVLCAPVFNNLMKDLEPLDAADRNAITRVYCYMVCQCWSYQDFSRSQELMAKDLDMGIRYFRARLKWLINHHYIHIKRKHIHFNDKPAEAAIYQLYISAVPNHYVNTKWWEGQLADDSTTAIEDILEQYKNSF